MPFQQLDWFPTATSSYLESTIAPATVNDRYLYPGDALTDDGTVYFILGTGLGPLNDSADVYDSDTESSELYTNPELETLVETTLPYHYTLAYGADYCSTTGESVHLSIGRGHDPKGDDVYYAWWATARPGIPIIYPSNESDAVHSVVVDSFPQLEELFRNRESEPQLGTLSQLINRVSGLNETVDELVIEARTVARQRFGQDVVQADETEQDSGRRGSPHQETTDIPTVTDGTGLQQGGDYGVYAGDRLFLSETNAGLESLSDVSNEVCLHTANHFVVRDANPSADPPTVTMLNATTDEIAEYTADEFMDIKSTAVSGGRYLHALYRDAYIEVLGLNAPFSYTLHVYYVTGATDTPHFLITYDRHDLDTPLLEHPYGLHTARLTSLDGVLDTLSSPTDAFEDKPGDFDEWATEDNVKELSTRAETVVEDMVEKRGIPHDTH
ncbi:hypothetical protein [Salinibaculum rarum]|uniref:hypothetical protein n=1 Tax=Salinibaculum rarum TaxID=3058903 RepID=UPI0026604EB3|nr:hypothetical protein [Salinibaculum sp. KK48]